jgi:hypothetical protein
MPPHTTASGLTERINEQTCMPPPPGTASLRTDSTFPESTSASIISLAYPNLGETSSPKSGTATIIRNLRLEHTQAECQYKDIQRNYLAGKELVVPDRRAQRHEIVSALKLR